MILKIGIHSGGSRICRKGGGWGGFYDFGTQVQDGCWTRGMYPPPAQSAEAFSNYVHTRSIDNGCNQGNQYCI